MNRFRTADHYIPSWDEWCEWSQLQQQTQQEQEENKLQENSNAENRRDDRK